MTDLSAISIIGIDRGASFTDFAVVENGQLTATTSLETRDWQAITETWEKFQSQWQTEHIVFSGSASGMPEAMQAQARVIAEIDAIGFGGAALAGLAECIVVSMGTGTAIVHFAGKSARHVGGTGVGGGTIKGLCSLICDLQDPGRIEALALEGNRGMLNLTLADLGYKGLSFLGSDMTASNFAAVKSRRPADVAAAVLDLVAETVGIIASVCAREANCPDRIVVIGKVAGNRIIRDILKLVGKLYQTNFIFPPNPGYATAYGAALKYRHDLAGQ